MSAILGAPVMTVDEQTGDGFSSGSRNPDKALSFFATAVGGTEGCFRGESLGNPRAIPSRPKSSFPFSPDPGPGDESPKVDATSSAQSSPPARPLVPESPGEALLGEFDALYHTYRRRVYRQCFRMLANAEDAEDLTQEVFLQVFRKAHTFRGEANFSTWLHRLTVNTVLMRLRRHRRWREDVTSMDVAPGSDQEVSDVLTMMGALPAQSTSTLDRIGLDSAIAQLSSGYKEIFLLHDLEGYRHDEIGRLLGITEGTSKSQLHKARLRLRELIGSPSGRSACSHSAAGTRISRRKRSPVPHAIDYAVA
ncbi:MAG: RNA polymerase sigma factor [Terriglobia bacterium]